MSNNFENKVFIVLLMPAPRTRDQRQHVLNTVFWSHTAKEPVVIQLAC